MYVLLLQGIIDLVGRLFRSIWYFLDHTIYSWVPKLYNALISISRTSPLSQADIADMADRIYKLLAVFMVFKVTFSLIMYVVNPDDFSDKNKGVSKLVTNIVISLGLLVLTPYIFSYAYQFQILILKNNTLATVIFGKDLTRESNSIDNVGDQIAFISMSPFLIPDLSMFPNCNVLYNIEYDNNGKAVVKLNEACFGFSDIDVYAAKKSCTGTDTLCSYVCGENTTHGTDSCSTYGFSHNVLVNYAVGVQRGNYHMFFKKDAVVAMIEKDDETEFIFDYSYILSTAVAVIILLFFITTCMDIGLRSIKLAFLQLIAPIPILSYIDPKSGKDGMFKKWYQMALKTYLSLFIRLLALYFAIYVIGRLDRMTDIIDGSYISTGVVKVFITIGALMFAKNFVKILEDLGIKLDGGFTLNPIKKIKDQALGGKQLFGAAGALTAAGAAGAVNLAHRSAAGIKNTGKAIADGFSDGRLGKSGIKGIWGGVKSAAIGGTKSLAGGTLRAAGSSIAGAASAGHRGLIRASKGEGFFKTFGNSYGEAMFAKKQREDLQRKVGATTMGDRIKFTAKSTMADVKRWGGLFNAGQQQEIDLANLDAEYNNRRDVQKKRKEELEKSHQEKIVEKNNKIKQSQAKQENFTSITKSIATLKNSHVNVKDREENVKQMQERGEWYAKVGDVINKKVKAGATYERKLRVGESYTTASGEIKFATDEDVANGMTKKEVAASNMTVQAIATQDDVDNLALTLAGSAADADLKKARVDGLAYLEANDGATKQLLKQSKTILMEDDSGLRAMLKQEKKADGNFYTESEIDSILANSAAREKYVDEALKDPSKIKTLISIAESEVRDINTQYASDEKEYEEQKNEIDLELKTIEDRYQKDIKEKHLDKTSREWIENEAANAARAVKNKEPEGFKPSPTVDESTYTPFNTAMKQGNAAVPPSGPRPVPPGGPRGH